jgi:prepilin-type N-terminal cleavage/methylation domain-containing protein
MRPLILSHRRGMTLPELLVVVAIMGLLAVAVAPLFRGASDKRKLAAAADLMTAHLNGAAAKAIGSRDGGGAWLETEAGGSGSDQAVAALLLARPRLASSGTAQITATDLGAVPPFATLNITTPSPVPLVLAPLIPEALISFQGIPTRYRLKSTTRIEMLPTYSVENAAFPAEDISLPFSIALPPRRKPSASAPNLGGDTCIDFSASTIGVYGLTPTASVQQLSNVAVSGRTTSFQSRILSIVFDGVGRATTAWVASDHSAATSSSWARIDLGPTMPVALLIGNRSQIGQTVVTQPTEDIPGPNFQNPDAVWVIIDPRTSVVRTVANNPATTLQAAQQPVAEALSNQVRAF